MAGDDEHRRAPATTATSHRSIAEREDSDGEKNRDQQRRERRLVQYPGDRAPRHTARPTTISGYSTTSAPPAAATPLPPLRKIGNVWPMTAATPRTHAAAPAADRRGPTPAAIAPLAKSRSSTSAPAFQPSSRATFDAPGLPEPSCENVATVRPGDQEGAREGPEQPGDGNEERDGDQAPPFWPNRPRSAAQKTSSVRRSPGGGRPPRWTNGHAGAVRLALVGVECQSRRPSRRSVHADIRVPLRQVWRADRGVPVVRRHTAHEARGLWRQADQGAVGRGHRPQGLGLLQDRQPVGPRRAASKEKEHSGASSGSSSGSSDSGSGSSPAPRTPDRSSKSSDSGSSSEPSTDSSSSSGSQRVAGQERVARSGRPPACKRRSASSAVGVLQLRDPTAGGSRGDRRRDALRCAERRR